MCSIPYLLTFGTRSMVLPFFCQQNTSSPLFNTSDSTTSAFLTGMVERSQGKFMRQFRLPENGNVDEVKAAMENGILTVNVSKVEALRMDIKSIEISGYFGVFLVF
ncbi:hypothetical protein AMTR_s00165p00049070 [Amborella trichopoda]|uniref:SHSP domain-containing protein n=1 Tax=Amborella trichopoda TaxID=13333 RepID=W1PX72_AMBTC|nr:hypothetical protein AMTR_s00165p00049070 [Amborella trichopoda]